MVVGSFSALTTGALHCLALRGRAPAVTGSCWRPGSCASRRSTTPDIGSGFGSGKGFGMPLHFVGWSCEAFLEARHLLYHRGGGLSVERSTGARCCSAANHRTQGNTREKKASRETPGRL